MLETVEDLVTMRKNGQLLALCLNGHRVIAIKDERRYQIVGGLDVALRCKRIVIWIGIEKYIIVIKTCNIKYLIVSRVF